MPLAVAIGNRTSAIDNPGLMDDAQLIECLIATCSRQLDLYRQLNEVSQKILSRVVLSRGDLSGVGPALIRKQEVLQAIGVERDGAKEAVAAWQDRKQTIRKNRRTEALDAILADMESSISRFLDKEGQLKKYLEHAMGGQSRTSG